MVVSCTIVMQQALLLPLCREASLACNGNLSPIDLAAAALLRREDVG